MPETTTPPPARTVPDPLARIDSHALRGAARQVLSRLSGQPEAGPNGAALAGRIADLALRVEAARDDEPAHREEPSDARLLDLLLAAELQERDRNGSPASVPELLRVLRSFEHARTALAREGDPPAPFEDPAVVVGLAHDLRSPLTSVLFLSDALRSGYTGELSETQRRQVGIIYSAALGLVSMANDILDLYRRGTKLVDDEASGFSIGEVFDSIRDIVLPIAEERAIDLRLTPPAGDRRLGHPVALARVLLNLTANGLKYTETGFVEVAARPTSPTRVEFSVRDSGPGIRPEDREKLFHPVRKVDRWDGPGFSGTGLGLALARHLVRSMGSDLAYETGAGAGTRFYFELDLPPAPGG